MSAMHPAADAVDIFAGARKAASLIVLRDTDPGGMQVLMLRRAERDGDFRSGMAVFPGGVLDARDRQAHAHCIGWNDEQASVRLKLPEGGLDYLVAAVRESFEEVGLLFTAGDDAQALSNAHDQWRGPLQRGEAGIAAMCETLSLQIDLRGWHCWSHWLTPMGNPKRFDTRFFVARAPQGQQAVADGGEAVELMWLTPAEALSPQAGLRLLPVTRRTLQQIGRFACVADALLHAQALGDLPMIQPRYAAPNLAVAMGQEKAKQPRIVLPDEHAWAEIGRLDPLGKAHVLAEIIAGHPVRLSPRVIRLTAPNPGVMTGPGTNTYLVADAEVNRWTAIDPGPASEAHLRALLAAAPGPIERILVTHTHADHSPGARALAAATGAPVFGMRARHPAGQDAGFNPSAELQGGERFALGPDATLVAHHTPGHASNHLCYELVQEKLLFTGDHVMQGSTVVINPPDGDMAAYFAALSALLEQDLDWFAPGHGFLVAQPHAVVRALIAHRQRRENKVLAALKALGPAPLETLVAQAYDDTPQALHGMARRSLLAHLLKLQSQAQAVEAQSLWRLAAPEITSRSPP